MTVPSALQHAVVYRHTGLPIPSPAHVTLAGGIARACTDAQGLQKGDKSITLSREQIVQYKYGYKSLSSVREEFLNDQF